MKITEFNPRQWEIFNSNRISQDNNKNSEITQKNLSINDSSILIHGEEEIPDEELRRDDWLGKLVNKAFGL